MRDHSLHRKKDGRTYQMKDYFTMNPIPFASGKHNYTARNIESLSVGHSMTFLPMFGNKNPIATVLVRIA